jgi:hypothetical protein
MISTTVETEDTMQPITWADGFGVWHVRVSRHAASPLIAARRSLRDELQARERNLDPRIFMHPIRVTDLDTEDAVVYREGELVRCPTTRITTDGTSTPSSAAAAPTSSRTPASLASTTAGTAVSGSTPQPRPDPSTPASSTTVERTAQPKESP